MQVISYDVTSHRLLGTKWTRIAAEAVCSSKLRTATWLIHIQQEGKPTWHNDTNTKYKVNIKNCANGSKWLSVLFHPTNLETGRRGQLFHLVRGVPPLIPLLKRTSECYIVRGCIYIFMCTRMSKCWLLMPASLLCVLQSNGSADYSSCGHVVRVWCSVSTYFVILDFMWSSAVCDTDILGSPSTSAVTAKTAQLVVLLPVRRVDCRTNSR